MSDEHEDGYDDYEDDARPVRRQPRPPVPAPRDDNRLTQNVRAALDKMGYQTTERDDVNGPIEAGTDLAKHITTVSSGGMANLMLAALTAGMMFIVWQLMSGQQDALGTVATHQTAMQRRIDGLKEEIEDVHGELVNLRFAISQRQDFGPRSPSPYDIRPDRRMDSEPNRNR